MPHLLPLPAPLWEAARRDLQQQLPDFGNASIPETLLYGQFEDRGLGVMIQPWRRHETENSVNSEQNPSRSAFNLAPDRLVRLCLYKVHMVANGSLQMKAAFHEAIGKGAHKMGFYTAYQSPQAQNLQLEYHHIPSAERSNVPEVGRRNRKDTMVITLKAGVAGAHLVEIGVFHQGTTIGHEAYEILHLTSLTVRPIGEENSGFTIGNIEIRQRGVEPNVETRLTWTWSHVSHVNLQWPGKLPWSATTGPFSHFMVVINEEEVASAYCLEFPVREEDYNGLGELRVSILGYRFGGGLVVSPTRKFSRSDLCPAGEESWAVVSGPDSDKDSLDAR